MVSVSNLHHPMVHLLIIHETGLVVVFYNILGYSLTDALGSCLFLPFQGHNGIHLGPQSNKFQDWIVGTFILELARNHLIGHVKVWMVYREVGEVKPARVFDGSINILHIWNTVAK